MIERILLSAAARPSVTLVFRRVHGLIVSSDPQFRVELMGDPFPLYIIIGVALLLRPLSVGGPEITDQCRFPLVYRSRKQLDRARRSPAMEYN